MTENEGLNELIKMRDRMDSQESSLVVQNSQITDPAKEVEGALTSFITSRIERIERDSQFADLVKMQIRGRFSEFTIDQLLQLNEQVTKSNNKGVETLIPLMVGDTGGKTTFEHLRDAPIDNAAKNLYQTADKDMLQAISYLNSVMARIAQRPQSDTVVVEAETTN